MRSHGQLYKVPHSSRSLIFVISVLMLLLLIFLSSTTDSQIYSKSDLSILPMSILSLNDTRNLFLTLHFLKNEVRGMNNELMNISSLLYSNLLTTLFGCLCLVTLSRYRRAFDFQGFILSMLFVIDAATFI